jgi:hypothetical protein
MQKELGTEHNLGAVRERFLYHFVDVFGYSDIQKHEDGGSTIDDRHLPSSIFDPRPALG